ncbi:MAG: hypothetical protein H6686_08920 [Fibrobacteria bacterium]|nr:hypothetical protein [Fibrobacteria bacterium]
MIQLPTTSHRIPRMVAVAGSEFRFVTAHLLRRLTSEALGAGRAPEILEVAEGRALPASCDCLVETAGTRPTDLGMPGVRQDDGLVEASLDWAWSVDRPVWRGAYIRHGLIVAADCGRAHVLGPVRALRIPGVRHVQAVLPAVAAALSWGVDPRALREPLFSWTGPEHMLQWRGEIGGVALFDDAASCTAEGLDRALDSFDQRLTLVTGGLGFHAGFELLDKIRSRSSRVVLLPGTPNWVATTWGRLADAVTCLDLADAALEARDRTLAGGQVLFCPGCLPRDGEPGLMQRGDRFAREFLQG